ncbi:MAG: ABC transporter substrate-binding protein [Burkholderiales bacterium]|nr:ABC transporter substrate-binding protein [Burkholderiales bacterium]
MNDKKSLDFVRRRLLQTCASIPFMLSSGAAISAPTAAAGRRFKIFVVIHREGALADEGFMDYLKNAGLNVEFVIRNTAGDVKLLPDIVEEIRQQKADLVYTQSTQVTAGIAGLQTEADPSKFIRDIPVVFSMVGDPLAAKLVRNLEKPDRNLTGAIHIVSLPVQLKAMQAYMPIKRLGILYTPNEKTQREVHDQLKRLATGAKIELVAADPLGADKVPNVDRLVPMLDRMAALKPDLVYVPAVNFFGSHSDFLMQEALKRKLPTFCAIEVQIKSGGLMGLVAPFFNVGALAGYKAEQILLGKTAIQKTPIEVLSKFSFMVNMPTARALALYPPMQVLRFAQIIGA